MATPYIVDHQQNLLEPHVLFGKNTKRLLVACEKLMHFKLYPYEGCYKPNMPTMPMTSLREFKAYRESWYAAHPEELAKVNASRKAWEEERDRQFRIIYGIAKKNHLYIIWCGNSNSCCCPDQFLIEDGKRQRIGVIHCC